MTGVHLLVVVSWSGAWLGVAWVACHLVDHWTAGRRGVELCSARSCTRAALDGWISGRCAEHVGEMP